MTSERDEAGDGAASQPWPEPPSEALSGRALRKLTREATEAHGGGSIADVIGEIYSILVSGGIAWLIVIGTAQTLGAQTDQRTPLGGTPVDPGWLVVAALVLSAGVLLGLFARLGPMSLGAGHATWWLPMPADRGGLLRPRWAALPVIASVFGLAFGAAAGALAGGADLIILTVITGVLLGANAVMVSIVRQIRLGTARQSRSPRLILAGDVMTVVGPLLALAVVLVRPAPFALVPALVVLAVLLLIALVVLGWWTGRNLDAISAYELKVRGAVTGHAAGSVLSLDTRELGRALSSPTTSAPRRSSRSFSLVRGPVTALLAGDALTMMRSPRHVIQVGVGAAIALIPLAAGWSVGLCLVGIVAGGYIAALATGHGARQADVAPVLDRVFPIAAGAVRRVRAIWPLAVMLPWCLGIFGVWGWTSGDLWGWLALGALGAPTFAAGVVRAAYRRPPDWSKPLVPGPAGPMPPGVIGAFSKGPDIVVLCLIPIFIAATITGVNSTVMFSQLATTLLALAIGCYVSSGDAGAQPKNTAGSS